MDKQLQDLAWSVLPKEFKEEVKKMFEEDKKHPEIHTTCGITTAYHNNMGQRLIDLFGLHNLASDAEGEEEMLCVSRKRVQKMYAHYDKISNDPNRPKDHIESVYEYADGITIALDNLFGSKCLPDEGTDCTPVEVGVAENATTTQTSAEPKFKEGDIVRYRYDGKSYTVVCKTGKYYYALRQPDGAVMIHDVLESDLEPYTEPTANYLRSEGALNTAVLAGNYSSASTCDKQFDNIIKDGFKNHNRLHIAAMAMAGLLANTNNNADISEIVADALQCADTLIAECEKGGPK